MGAIGGRPVAVMANDPTVKAGSWGAQDRREDPAHPGARAARTRVPLIYLVDSAGARITDQVQMFPGRRGAGRIFYNEVQLSGVVPQVCVLFGPCAAGGAYIPAFCDVVIMVDGNASHVPRLAAHGRDGDRREGHARGDGRRADAHRRVRAAAHFLVKTDEEGIDLAKRYLALLPVELARRRRRRRRAAPPAADAPIRELIPADENKPFDMRELIDALVDDGLVPRGPEALGARSWSSGFARLDGRVVGIVANQPKQKGGVLFVDSADKAARFIWTCDAFNIPLLFLADVPGFMIGTQVERQGIIRARREDDLRRLRGDRAEASR